MRLWSIHPRYLDCKGLLALWRESLLAKRCLQGKSRGYNNHPQLTRFKESRNPIKSIDSYLFFIYQESLKRCYKFDKRKIGNKSNIKIRVSSGQLMYELNHLKKKLRKRDPKRYKELLKVKHPEANPLFIVTKGPIEGWEKVK